ncbi:MAG: hypothetical protein ACOY71_08170 [Gemmatimonadota bacterium]
MPRLVAIYRSPTYSPAQHACNDTEIMNETVRRLIRRGWQATRIGEADVEAGRIPAADLYLTMCQGAAAAERLLPLEVSGALVINRPSSILNCHRHRLVPALADTGIPFPRTLIVPTAAESAIAGLAFDRPLWLKRGDVHAERADDVVMLSNGGLESALRAFAARGIARAALQEHVDGPVVKFYGVADGSLFHAFLPDGRDTLGADVVDLAALRDLAFSAARQLGLDVFGGDAAVPAPDRPVLIDLNDWPSFAPIRLRAADAISAYVDITYRCGRPA